MVVTLSPAKIQNFGGYSPLCHSTEAKFASEASELIKELSSLSVEEIMALMKVNINIAQSTYHSIHTFDTAEAKQAAYVYDGIAFQGLAIDQFSIEDLQYAQDHLVLLSGLYGFLRPLDEIKPYRLEVQANLKNREGENLYAFWRELITQELSTQLLKNNKIWVNLTSKEYSKSINVKALPEGTQIITPVFKEFDGNKYKQVVVYVKKARGMMARFIMKNRIEDIEYLKAFDEEGYSYSEALSSNKEWVFIR